MARSADHWVPFSSRPHINDRNCEQDACRFDINLDDGRWAQVTQLENPGLSIGSRVIIRDEQVYLLR